MADQVGGDHYKADYQHWDMVADTFTGYFEANATKYLGRWRKKNGEQDLDKALSYMIKIQELLEDCRWENHSDFTDEGTFDIACKNLSRWFISAGIHDNDKQTITACLTWKDKNELQAAISYIRTLKRAAVGLPAAPAPATHGSAKP